MTQASLLTDERPYLLVKCELGLSPRDVTRIMAAIALLRGVECTFNALLTGLPTERLDVLTGVPTPAARRRKVSLAG